MRPFLSFFVILILAFVYFNASPLAAKAVLDVRTTGAFTVCLLASSVTFHFAEKAMEGGRHQAFTTWLLATIGLGAVFMVGQVHEYQQLFSEGMSVNTSLFASTFFTLTGFHGLHVTGGLIAFLFLLGRTYVAKRLTHEQKVSAIVVSYYWHFVDVVWIGLFTTIYLIH